MKSVLAFAALASLLTSCASQSPVTRFAGDAATVTAAGAAGYQASDKNAAVAAGSAVAALGVKRFIESRSDKARIAELDEAYRRGMSQAAKTADMAIQNAQRDGFPEQPAQADLPPEEVLRLPITAPERVINGVRIKATQEVVTLPK